MSIRKNPIAYLALFVALGGTSYARDPASANSVGTHQLRNGAVTDTKVRRHSLWSNVFVPGALPQPLHTTVQSLGTGPPAEGPPPPAGTPITINVPCPSGQHAVGGGWDFSQAGGSADVTVSKPYANDNGWTVTFTANQEPFGIAVAYAVCAS